MSLDLEKHLVFYGAYHHNAVNIAIHVVCVPMILLSGFCMATYTGTLVPTPAWLTIPYLDLNLGTIAATLYATLYLLLEPFAGFMLAAFCLGGTAACHYIKVQHPESTFTCALTIHLVCWVMQFIGHGAFEGRAPALLDNLVQAIFLAPMFVWLEVLFKLGYRPELQARVEERVKREIGTFRAASKNGKAK